MEDRKSGVGRLTYEQIRKDIILGRLKEGSKLKLSALKQRYEVSMMTLRNILHSLSDEGFVVAEEQRGFFVAPLSEKNLLELADLRFLLESRMIEISFARADLEWESRVLASYHRLQGLAKNYINGDFTTEEVADLKLADYAFHCVLISGCDSAEWLSIHKTVFDKYQRYLFHCNAFRGQLAEEEHKVLADSALAQDAKMAKRVLKTHIYECVKAIKKLKPDWSGKNDREAAI